MKYKRSLDTLFAELRLLSSIRYIYVLRELRKGIFHTVTHIWKPCSDQAELDKIDKKMGEIVDKIERGLR